MLLLWIVTALAAPCPDVSDVVDEAWAAFNDAELAQAKEHLHEATGSLTCQQRAVTTEELLELYRLDSLVSLAQEDEKGALYATIRLVTIDPDAPPGDELGPVIAEMHETWSERLDESRVHLVLEGEGEAWVDGRSVTAEPLEVVEGEHLVQARDPSGWHAVVTEIDHDARLVVGEGLEIAPDLQPLDPSGEDDPPPEIVPPPPVPADPAPPNRVGMLIGGGAGVAGGGVLLGWAYTQEVRFRDDPYLEDSYGGCDQLEECYRAEREKVIRADAARIRTLYAAGYVAAVAGLAVLGTELFLLPDPAGGGGSVGVRVKW